MKRNSLGGDPHLTGIIFGIEILIHEHDKAADCAYNDSLVKSALNMTASRLKGKEPKNPPKSDKDRFKHNLSNNLVDDAASLDDVPAVDYIRALSAVEVSLKRRRDHHNSARGYLDFLEGFIKEAGGTVIEEDIE